MSHAESRTNLSVVQRTKLGATLFKNFNYLFVEMAKTKQVAAKSTGGTAPKRPRPSSPSSSLSLSSSSESESEEDSSSKSARQADDSELPRIRKEARDEVMMEMEKTLRAQWIKKSEEAVRETKEKIKRMVRETFECVVCLHIPKERHLIQCQNGHQLCDECMDKLIDINGRPTCPTCRVSLSPNNRIRALAAEHLIEFMNLEYECKHPRCEFIACKNDTIEHEKMCEHRMVPCPDYECCTQQQHCNRS